MVKCWGYNNCHTVKALFAGLFKNNNPVLSNLERQSCATNTSHTAGPKGLCWKPQGLRREPPDLFHKKNTFNHLSMALTLGPGTHTQTATARNMATVSFQRHFSFHQTDNSLGPGQDANNSLGPGGNSLGPGGMQTKSLGPGGMSDYVFTSLRPGMRPQFAAQYDRMNLTHEHVDQYHATSLQSSAGGLMSDFFLWGSAQLVGTWETEG